MSLAILLVDDDRAFSSMATAALEREGLSVTAVHALHGARRALGTQDYDLVLLDRRLPDGDGQHFLPELLAGHPGAAVVMVTADDDIGSAVEALRLGARDYVVKPVNLGELIVKIRRATEEQRLRDRLERVESELSAHHRMVPPASRAMRSVVESLERIAGRSRSPVLLLGETGVGKEVLARHLHGHGTPSAPFVHLNCAAINEQTAESELFGHEKGAFTDARTSRRGLVEVATGGTLFLDEVGELTLTLQAKLLTFLDAGQFRRLGGVQTRSSTARIVAATNRDLEAEIKRGSFRADLWFRLSVFKVVIPPLRERREDLLVLTDAILKDLARHAGKGPLHLTPAAQARLASYPFHGNVRELKSVLEQAAVMEPSAALELAMLYTSVPAPLYAERFVVAGDLITLEALQDRYVSYALDRMDGRRMDTAQALGISYPTLAKRLGR